MRLFIAIELPTELKEFLDKLNGKLKSIQGVKKVQKEVMHLTLLFLGETYDVEEVINKLKTIKNKTFKLETGGIGFFPNKDKPKVTWIDIKPSNELTELQGKIGSLFNNEKEYKAHITFARLKYLSRDDKRKMLKVLDQSIIPVHKIKVDKFKLYSSELTPMGPIHNVIETF